MARKPRSAAYGFVNPFDRLTTRSLTWGAIIAAIVLAINVPLTVRNTRSMEQTAELLAHSHEVVNTLAGLMLHLESAESDVRGFVATADSADAIQPADIRGGLVQQLNRLDSLVADNASQRERLAMLRRVATARVAALDTLQRVARTRGPAAARAILQRERRLQRPDSVRLVIDGMTGAEQVLLTGRAQAAEETYEQAARSGVFAGTAALVAFLGFVIVLRRELAARHEAATLLAAERERLDTTLRSIGDAVITTDTKGLVTTMNVVAEQLTGRSAMSAVGQPLDAVYRIPIDPSASLGEHPVHTVLSGRRARSALHQVTLRSHDGTERPIDQTAAAIVTPSGERLGGVLVFRDVSEQQAAQQRIRASQQRLQLALRSARMVSFDVPLDGGAVTLSDNGSEVLGMPPGRQLQSLADALTLVHPDDLADVQAAIAAATTDTRNEGFRVSCRIRREVSQDIGWVEVRGEIQTARDGRPILAGLLLDITDRRAAEQSLRESEARFRSMADSAPVMIWVVGGDGLVRYLNQRWFDFSGMQPTDPTPSLADWVHPDDQSEYRRVTEQARAARRPYRHEFRLRRHDGSYRWVINTATPRVHDDGEWLGYIGSILDIEDRKRLEDELRSLARDLSDADRRKDEFLATLAHELRNPLAPIRNGIEILRLAAPSPDIIERTRGMMERQVVQLVRLVDDLLDVSRISSGKLELRPAVVPLSDIISTARESTAPHLQSRGQRLHVTMPQATVVVHGDAARLSQVLANLLDNASKYSPHNTDIRIDVSASANHVQLRVRDQGQGIPPQQLHQIFDLFTQVDRTLERTTGGLGIGLTLVKRLVEMHGGSIVAESAGDGTGSTFTVTLPVLQQPDSAGEGPQTLSLSAAQGLRIVVCDDNADAATTLSTVLQADGHDVATVHRGEDAVQLALVQQPDVIILDLGMPGLNGFDTAEQIRVQTAGPAPCLIALTGWGADDYRDRTRRAGFDHHLVKPADLSALRQILATVKVRTAE
ncbi:PAS domain S-box protein [Gemmatimonas sp. UBA7669]|uniref:PAS domain S-box protein n=1 Tax=Gemmatimonas sp. UBA7669 TaxID=1946568 RepID=UPI0025C14BC8|nr:PAS domain S-box protein [Gemmatimonas sp. UBA7669]